MVKKLYALFALAVVCLLANSQQAAAIALSGSSPAVNVAVVLDTPGSYWAEPEKVYGAIDDTMKVLFKESSAYKVQSVSDTDAYVQVYREENGQATTDDNGYMAGTGVRDLSLKKDDLAKLSEHFGADYLIYARVTSSAPQVKIGFMSGGQKVNVTTDFRIWSTKKKDFVYMKRYITSGSSNSFYAGMGDSGHAVEKGLKKGLKEVEKDATKIRTAMIE